MKGMSGISASTAFLPPCPPPTLIDAILTSVGPDSRHGAGFRPGARLRTLRAVTYRGEEEAQRARIGELEQKLDAASAEIAVLRGEKPATAPGTKVVQSRVLGAPNRYEREVVLPYAISERGYEAIAEVLRTRLKLNAIQVGRALTVPSSFSLTRDEDGSRIRLTGDWSVLAGGVVASSVMAAVFGSIVSGGVLADVLDHAQIWHQPLVDAGFVAAVLALATTLSLGTGALTRWRASKEARRELADHEGTFEAILALAEEHRIGAPPPTRVASESDAGEPEATDDDSAPDALRKARD